MAFIAKCGISNATIEAKIIRADGTVENLGTIARYRVSLIKKIEKLLKRIKDKLILIKKRIKRKLYKYTAKYGRFKTKLKRIRKVLKDG